MHSLPKILIMMITALSVLMGFGCFGIKQSSPKIDFYSLEYDPPQVSSEKKLPAVIRVNMFSIAPPYDTQKMVYRETGFKKDAYSYHRWWNKPNELVTAFLARDLKSSGLFEAVFAFDRTIPATHSIYGAVEEFYELDAAPDVWQAVMSLTISLVDDRAVRADRSVLFQKKYSLTEHCQAQTPLAVAQAMSKNMETLSAEIIKDTYKALHEYYSSGRKSR